MTDILGALKKKFPSHDVREYTNLNAVQILKMHKICEIKKELIVIIRRNSELLNNCFFDILHSNRNQQLIDENKIKKNSTQILFEKAYIDTYVINNDNYVCFHDKTNLREKH